MNFILLDACNNNPLRRAVQKRDGSGRGLAKPTGSALGLVYSYAAQPGEPASDGRAGQNGPYAAALARHLKTEGITYPTVFSRVIGDVYRATNKGQLPYYTSSIFGDDAELCLNPNNCRSRTRPPPSPRPVAPSGGAGASRGADGSASEVRPGMQEPALSEAKGCDEGKMRQCFNLGVSYRDGEGVRKSDAEAVRLYRRACESGHTGGCVNLGIYV